MLAIILGYLSHHQRHRNSGSPRMSLYKILGENHDTDQLDERIHFIVHLISSELNNYSHLLTIPLLVTVYPYQLTDLPIDFK